MTRLFLCVLPLISCVLASCNSESAPNLDTFPVTGKVTLDGEPVAGISVTFFPADGTPGNGASGTTDAQGQFSLKTPDQKEGAPTGKYRVLFTLLQTPDGKPIPADEMAADVGATNVLPEIYNDPQQTPMGSTVSESGADPSEFALKSK